MGPKKERKTMKDFFTSNGRNSAEKFLEGLNKWFVCKKKGGSIYLVRTNTIEKNNKKKKRNNNGVEQNQFHKKR